MERQLLFGCDLFTKTNIANENQSSDLLNQINDAKEKNVLTQGGSNDGCWRSSMRYKNIEWLTNCMLDTASEATIYYAEQDKNFRSLLSKSLNYDYWTNVNEIGSGNVLHSHKFFSSFSGIYYIQGEDTGNLVFYNTQNLMHDCYTKSPFTKKFKMNPKDNSLVLFPSWVPHEVEENKSDRQRINIAFNVTIG